MKHQITLSVNGDRCSGDVEPRTLLVHFLREQLGLTGTHVGCVVGECGACSVIVDGALVKSCLMLAVQADGCDVTTVEGLADQGRLHPIQASFVKVPRRAPSSTWVRPSTRRRSTAAGSSAPRCER